jgi:hypothetical protein
MDSEHQVVLPWCDGAGQLDGVLAVGLEMHITRHVLDIQRASAVRQRERHVGQPGDLAVVLDAPDHVHREQIVLGCDADDAAGHDQEPVQLLGRARYGDADAQSALLAGSKLELGAREARIVRRYGDLVGVVRRDGLVREHGDATDVRLRRDRRVAVALRDALVVDGQRDVPPIDQVDVFTVRVDAHLDGPARQVRRGEHARHIGGRRLRAPVRVERRRRLWAARGSGNCGYRSGLLSPCDGAYRSQTGECERERKAIKQ